MVNIIFALGCSFCIEIPSYVAKDFYLRAENLIEPRFLRHSSLESLQALILLSLYLQGTDGTRKLWVVIGAAVRIAQALGLHDNKIVNNAKSPLEMEVRKRVWWACYVLDAVSALRIGRLPTISQGSFHVDLPSCVDDELLSDTFATSVSDDNLHASTQINHQPQSYMSFFHATIQLCRFMPEVMKSYDNPEKQARILEIDEQLCDFAKTLPAHLRPEGESSVQGKLWRQKEVLTSR